MVEDAIGDRDLADVVQPAAEPAAQNDVLAAGRAAGNRARQLGDLFGVPLGQALAHARRERERLREPDRLGLLGGEIRAVSSLNMRPRSRPRRLAAYSARSAWSTISSCDPAGSASTAPTETVTCSRRAPTAIGSWLALVAQGLADPPQRALVWQRRRQHDELLAAPARHAVVGANGVAQACRELDQHGVADLVAVGVVDGLEVVDVDAAGGRA